jgi:hypothetical protein
MFQTQIRRNSNFDTIWAALQEVAAKQKEITERQKETECQITKLGRRLGEIFDYMIMPKLMNKFREIGFVFTKAYPQANIVDREHNIFVKIDITLENSSTVMIISAKSRPTTQDVNEHVERMQKVWTHGDLHGDKRKFLGAIAGMTINRHIKHFALKNGFYTIEPEGETFIITVPEGEYFPREW